MLCEFCEEFRYPSHSRFARIYAPSLEDRLVARRGNLVAMPTIGQLFRGSLLILPTTHVETMASLPESAMLDLAPFLTDLESVIGRNGPVIAFEHGARCISGGGCGIYHAHLHLVPLSAPVSVDDLLPAEECSHSFERAPSLSGGLRNLRSSPEYLLVRDTDSRVRFIDLSSSPGARYPSQYFRRTLAERFNLDRPWDWRMFEEPEQYVFDTVGMFETANVSLSK